MKAIGRPNRVMYQRVCMHNMQIIVGIGVYRGLWPLLSLSLPPSLRPWTRGSGLNQQALRQAFCNPGRRFHPMYVVSPLSVMPRVLMVVRKGHNVVVPWPGHNPFYPQPQTQGGFHQDNVALSLF